MSRFHGVAALMLAACAVLGHAESARAQQSNTMRADCRALPYSAPTAPRDNSRFAEQWVRTRLSAFVPAPDQAQALRMRSLEREAEQVMLAFYTIRVTCAEYLAGSLPRDEADRRLDSSEKTIVSFIKDIGDDAGALAARGQVADMAAIRTALTDLGATGRQAALMGHDWLAEQARQRMVDALVSFSSTFVGDSCWGQSFDDHIPFSLQRQNDLLGTGIDVLPCARRRFTARAGSLLFESCTVRGVGEWRVRSSLFAVPTMQGGVGSGEMSPDGSRAKGTYAVDWGANGVEYRTSGNMAIARRENGSGVPATFTFSGDGDVRVVRGRELIQPFERLMGVRAGGSLGTFSVEAQVSERPCRSVDQ